MNRIVCTILLFLIGTALLVWASLYTRTEFELVIWAVGILWLNAVPIIHYSIVGKDRELFPYISILGFFITLSYSLPVFFINASSYEIAPLSKQALIYAFWGYAIFYLFYFLLYRFFQFKKGFDIIKLRQSDHRIRLLAFFFLIIYLISSRIHALSSLDYIGSTGIYLYLGSYLYLIEAREKTSILERLCFYLILTYVLLLGLISGAVANLALLFLYLTIILFISGRKFGKMVGLSLIFLAFYYLFAPVKYRYRQRIWFSNTEYSYLQKIEILKDLMLDQANYVRNDIYVSDKDRLHLLWRPSYDASALSLVLNKTPNEIPYWNGNTYIILPKLIPRLFWADKPVEDASLRFAKTYKLIPPWKDNSPYPLPVLAEMYINFGKLGILVGMVMLAILYNILNGLFNKKEIRGISKIYSISIIFVFIYHEGNFTMTFGNVPLLTISIYFICRLFQLPLFEKLWRNSSTKSYYDGYYPYWSESSNPFDNERLNGKNEEVEGSKAVSIL
jgi:hypothetical protein